MIWSWSTEGLELRGWVNGPKWRNCWMIVTLTSLTSEMSLSWPPRYTSIHELNKIINSPNILRLSSFILASLQQLNSCSCNQDLYCNSVRSHWQCRLKIRCVLYLAFEWRVQTNIWIQIYEMNGWETSSILTPARRPSRDPFLPILSHGTSEPGDSKGAHVTSCFENWSDTVSWCREQTGAAEFYLWFLTEKIVCGFTGVTR